jgi:hypothetical protein
MVKYNYTRPKQALTKQSVPQMPEMFTLTTLRFCYLTLSLPSAIAHQRLALIVAQNSSLYEHLVASHHQVCCQQQGRNYQMLKCKTRACLTFDYKYQQHYIIYRQKKK